MRRSPPWRAKRRKGRIPITRDAVVDAGLQVLEEVGVDELSMRLIANRLRTGAASLRHVRSKDELLQLLFEQMATMFREYLQSLPAEQFPHVHRTSSLLFAGNGDERFEFGMEVLVRGIESYISAPDQRV